jgi:small GTP-binding protein
VSDEENVENLETPKGEEEPKVIMREGTVYKIIVVGDGAVGKTSLIKKHVHKSFEKNYIPTVGVNIAKHTAKLYLKNGEEKEVTLMFWDIAGQPQFYMLHKVYYNGANGIIYVFDVTRPETFTHVKNWHSECIPGILVGNKTDLTYDRKIIAPMAESLAKQLDVPYYETSANNGEGVAEIFDKIVELIWYHYQQ